MKEVFTRRELGPVFSALLGSTALGHGWRLHVMVALGCAITPLYQVLGYEFALANTLMALCWTPLVGWAQARQRGWQHLGLTAALAAAILALLPGLGLMLLNGLRVPPCNISLGLTLYGLMPVGSGAMGAGLGWLMGALTQTWPKGYSVLALATAWATSLGLVLAQLYLQPAIVVYDPLWGYFSGSLYDEAMAIPQALWAVRATTLVALVALYALSWANSRPTPKRLAAAGVALWALAVQSYGIERRFGSRVSRRDIEAVLSHVETRPGLVVHLPGDIAPQIAAHVADDHSYRLHALTRRMGLKAADEAPNMQVLHSYVYANAGQKAALMGGGHTMVAKPWLFEVHINGTETPHSVLAHEMVHALAAAWAKGPLHVSARYGIWVNMGIIEGLAVALSPDGMGPGVLTQARALYAMHLDAPLPVLLGGPQHFWRLAPARAYTQAGALMRYLEERFGMAALRALYRAGDITETLGLSWHTLATDFRHWLAVNDSQAVPSLPMAQAQMRRTSIFDRHCAREVARLRQHAEQATTSEAVARLRQVTALTADAPSDVLALARALHRAGHDPEAIAHARAVMNAADVDATGRAAAQLLWAQLTAWATPQKAHESGDRVNACTAAITTMPWRGLDREAWVTRWLLRQNGPTQRALLPYVLGDGHQSIVAATTLAGLNDVTAQYLLGRLLYGDGADAEALTRLTAAGRHPYPPIEAERLHLAAQAAMHLGRWEEVLAYTQALCPPAEAEPYWGWAEDMAQRAREHAPSKG